MKINYMGRRINGRFSSFKSAVRRSLVWSLKRLAVIMVGVIIGAMHFSTSTVTAVNEIVTVPVDPAYPVLERIAQCESGGKHFGKSGQVLLNANTNGTVDVGRYQINTVWFAKATELGLNVMDEKDNEKLAKWIYTNHGTEPWYPSKHCWNK